MHKHNSLYNTSELLYAQASPLEFDKWLPDILSPIKRSEYFSIAEQFSLGL
jgi:hypothetical protein